MPVKSLQQMRAGSTPFTGWFCRGAEGRLRDGETLDAVQDAKGVAVIVRGIRRLSLVVHENMKELRDAA